jgi:hypothetical protein
MADKYLKQVSGVITEVEAKTSSAGAGDAGKIVALDTSGLIAESMLPVGVGADVIDVVCSENLSAGDFVNLWSDAGTGKVRKADASNGRRAIGFVLSAYTSGQTATVYFDGTNTALSAMTPGSVYYLSGGTAGAATTTAPSTSGYIVQEVGIARSATELTFQPNQPITLA